MMTKNMQRNIWIRPDKFSVLIVALFVSICSAYAYAQNVTIGVITDYVLNSQQRNELLTNFSAEISKTLSINAKVSLNPDHIVSSGFDKDRTIQAYSKLTAQCDFIVLLGITSTKTVLSSNLISKPTIALGITNTKIQNIPLTEKNTSGIDNFSYILSSRTLEQELEHFYEIYNFKKLSVLFHKNTINAIEKAKLLEETKMLSEKFNCVIYPILIDDDFDSSVALLPENTDAVFFGASYELTSKDILGYINSFNAKQLPSYSPLKEFVNLGILASVSSERDFTSIYRKLGVMIDDILSGTNAKDLHVSLGRKKQLYFNVNTSKTIQFSPSFQTIFTANLVHNEDDRQKVEYSITQILEKAIEENLGVKVSYKNIALAEQEIRDAKSNYLPTVNLSVVGSQINEDATNEFIGQSERTLTQATNASQLIYSEPAIANIKIQKLLNEAQKYATKQEVNNTIFQTYQLYLNILFSKSNVKIQKENLEVLKKNLELAELQAEIGAKNNSDVYRWKSEVANSTQQLIEAQTGLIISKATLNAFLNRTIGDEFEVEDIGLENNLYEYYAGNALSGEIKNPETIKKIARYLYEYATQNFPTVQELEYSIKALERQKKTNNRAFYLPSVSLGLSQSEVLERAGVASEPTSDLSNFIDSFWNVGVTVSYPLFEGNRKNIQRQQTTIQTDQLALQKKDLLNNLRLTIQTSITNLISSQTNIVLSEKSAENAQKNFEISQELYLESAISIVQFLDAQNASLSAKLNYINSIYNYVLSFAELENSIGFFSLLASPEDRLKFEQSIDQSIHNYRK